jgi:hypothetical protein
MARLSNESVKSFLLKKIIKEYRGFIVGANNNLMKDSHLISNSFNLFAEDGFANLSQESTNFVDQFKNISVAKGGLSDSDENLVSVKDHYIFDMLDNTYAAFFLKDIIAGSAFKEKNTIDKNNYFTVVCEKNMPSNKFDSSYYDKDFSIKKLVATVSPENNIIIPDTLNDTDNQRTQNNNETTPLAIAYNVLNGKDLKENKDLNKNPKNDPERLSPNLGAIVIKKHGIGLPSKNSDHLNIFFNAIPAIEMSRCVPYIDIAIVTRTEENLPNNINNATFMRFIKEEKNGNLVLDESIGLSSAKPFDFNSIFGIDEYSIENSLDISMMDIFSAPQVMANANVNNDIKYTKGIYGNEVLEPIAPLLSLTDLSIDIAGMGIALFSSKVGSINLKLHDRSRLADISHLISPRNFGTTKMIIEFGWSHPEGNLANENIIGQFLNSLRDRSIYTVKTSNFSFSEGNVVNIGLTLACYGDQHCTNVSSACGRLVPANVFKSGINSILTGLKNNRLENNSDKLKIKEVRNVMKVELRNSVKNDNLIEFETYAKIVKAYKEYKKNNLLKNEVKNALKVIIDPDKVSDSLDEDKINESKKLRKTTINKLMFEKLYALPFKDEHSNFLSDKFITSYNNADSKNFYLESINKFLPAGEEYISLGKLFMSFIGHPLAMSGVFDEVQIVFYPLNMHSAGASIHTTASMPIEYSLIQSVITEKLKNNSDINVKSFFNLIESKIIRDRSLSVYGISSVIREYNSKIEKKNNDLEFIDAKKSIEREKKEQEAVLNEYVQSQRSELLTDIETLKADSAGNEQISNRQKTFEEDIKNKSENLESKFLNSTVKERAKVKQIEEQIASDRKNLKNDIKTQCQQIYKQLDSEIRESKFVRPNLSLYMETLTQSNPAQTISSSAYDLVSILDGSYLKTLASQVGIDRFASNTGTQKTICRVHIYDENSSSNPRKKLIQNIMTENVVSDLIKKDKTIDISKLMKDLGLNTSVKIKNYIKNSYPSITYGSNNSTVQGISITSNVSDQVSQVIQISSYAKRNNPQSNASQVNDIEEITVVPSSISLRTMGNPFISRGNEIYIDFGTNTTLDNIYVVKSVSHNISNGKFETNVNLIYSGQGDTRSIAGQIKNTIENA